MEFMEALALMMVSLIGASFLIFLYRFLPKISDSRAKNTVKKTVGEENLKQTIKDMQENYGVQIQQLKKDRNRLQGIINRNQYTSKSNSDDEEEDEEEIDMNQYVFDKEMVRPMLAKWGMNTDALDNPMLQNIIMEKFKGNEELMIAIGVLRPRVASESQNESNGQAKSPAEDAFAQIGNWA